LRSVFINQAMKYLRQQVDDRLVAARQANAAERRAQRKARAGRPKLALVAGGGR
jgi:hypothetical protein